MENSPIQMNLIPAQDVQVLKNLADQVPGKYSRTLDAILQNIKFVTDSNVELMNKASELLQEDQKEQEKTEEKKK
jgi:hypothetical protein